MVECLNNVVDLLKNNPQIFSAIISLVSVVVAIVSVVVSVKIYCNSVSRAVKLATIEAYSVIRNKYENLSPSASTDKATENKRIEYLNEMEKFCTGVNCKIYNIEILKRMSGSRLCTQYDSYLKELIENRKQLVRNADESKVYIEYEKVIEKLKGTPHRKTNARSAAK